MGRSTAAGVLACLWGVCTGAGPDLTSPAAGPDLVQPAKADILYIGDSESLGYFGDGIYRRMAAKRDPKSGPTPNRLLTVWSYWTCGSDVQSWLVKSRTICGVRTCNTQGKCRRHEPSQGGPVSDSYGPLKIYLASVQPRLTVISLGTNFLTTHAFKSADAYRFYLDRAAAMVRQVKAAGSACLWIGPPQVALKTRNEAEYVRFVADLSRAVAQSGGTFIDSGPLSDRSLLIARDPEGTHFKGEGEKKWAAALWPVLEQALDRSLVTSYTNGR